MSTGSRRRRDGRRIAVIDVGSNSVRLVVFAGLDRAPEYFFNEKTACGLGAGLAKTGRLDPRGRTEALAVLRRFAALLSLIGVEQTAAVATAAVRDASDGDDFCRDVLAETGLALRVVSGADEARLAAQGALLAEPARTGAVLDMGGASVELCALEAGQPGAGVSLPLGPQRLGDMSRSDRRAMVRTTLKQHGDSLPTGGNCLTLVGGAWRAFAKIAMHRFDYPLRVLHGYRLTPDEVAQVCDWICTEPMAAIKAVPGVSVGRAANAAAAASVLEGVVQTLAPESVAISALGLREGVYYELLPKPLRARDPLLDACDRMETRQARFPGFGRELHAFIDMVAADWDDRDRRLMQAACQLNDVNWRTHPDYRPMSCFETVTRANLMGLDHRDRVFLGLSLMNRYGSNRPGPDVAPALALLDEAEKNRAKLLGRAMRLGAMLGGSAPGSLAGATLSISDGALTLALKADHAALAGPALDKRLASVAQALGCDESRLTVR